MVGQLLVCRVVMDTSTYSVATLLLHADLNMLYLFQQLLVTTHSSCIRQFPLVQFPLTWVVDYLRAIFGNPHQLNLQSHQPDFRVTLFFQKPKCTQFREQVYSNFRLFLLYSAEYNGCCYAYYRDYISQLAVSCIY